ncbi:glycosyltransferase [uncultured Novosphingobium sp.]|uniref:glycosyltransferase n=1 Tax=uncultured Novosphingobium sp. TaxID=292277 RepID=UPI0025978671|nr:glycosyltransferase [uncultured Novosphingobium sp.]
MRLEQCSPATVAYLGHDVNDAAVRRRVAMFREEGLAVRLGGFRRGDAVPPGGSPDEIVDFGKTADARLVQRALRVLGNVLAPRLVQRTCDGARVLVARNLEMLVLAWRVRRRGQRLVYECLDIHRLMLGSGCKSRLMRWIERKLLRRADLVLVSSPAFAREYFSARQGHDQAVLLVENKVPISQRAARRDEETRAEAEPRASTDTRADTRAETGAGADAQASPRVVIGWFGMLRCRRTLAELARIARADVPDPAAVSGARVEVLIAGIPSQAEFPDFAEQVGACPGLRYLGPYTPAQLPELYAEVDYIWAIDYFEEGLNSEWLLPNRLYEGLAHGAVPIALRRVETGRWLARHGVGLLVDAPEAELPQCLLEATGTRFEAWRRAVAALPTEALFQTERERKAIVAHVMGAAHD